MHGEGITFVEYRLILLPTDNSETIFKVVNWGINIELGEGCPDEDVDDNDPLELEVRQSTSS